MNWLDMTVLCILIFCAFAGYHRGFIQTLFRFGSSVLSFMVAVFCYPMLSRILRQTNWLFDVINQSVSESLGLEEAFRQYTLVEQQQIIDNMDLPVFLKRSLLENNNAVVYDLLDVGRLDEYISAFITNGIINIIALFLIFFIMSILVRLVLKSLDVLTKLPIIHTFNKWLGFFLGAAQGLFVIWVVFLLCTLFVGFSQFDFFFEALMGSVVALKIYNSNLLLYFILRIFS